MATNGNNGAQFTSTNAPSTVSATSGAAEPSSDSNLGKDEVAWFFVEQYYTTLSKTPEKLHLFYGKRSQFVVGREAEVANVSVGRQSIQERLKQLDLQDCKVRVSNVDSQASYDNIVIQVIGETSNKAGTPKKFVQTFVLAQQPSGYFVLNDLLRYIDDEGDEEPAEAAEEETATATDAPAAVPVAEAEAEQSSAAPASAEEAAAPSLDPGVIDKKLEEVSAAPEPVNGDSAKTDSAAEAVPAEASSLPNPEATLEELVAEEVREPEKPTDPSPTPVQNRQPAPPAAPAPAQPAKPMTWASRAAAAAVPKPVTPLPKTATPPTQARSAAPSTAQPAASAPTSAAPATTTGDESSSAAPAKESSEWQTAGSDSKRQNKPQAATGAQTEKEGTMGYVKYVTDKVKHDELKQALAQHGEVVYFDINRQKNCAFVEFATVAGYQAAVAANPHIINGESIQVEPRRPKAGAYGGSNYSAGRGGAPSRGGRGSFEGGRSGSSGGRGNFGGQNRGRGGAGAGAARGGAWGTA
ncbi:uncharacterized protein B0I36DRAFT_371555 [Microdochium trichocladiopsis]|uniref:NTF2 domain-containing protein n=1 Tax=Microdochium trichocladiopsis TaxID=1682393 RepID=A0A9P9BWE0_9PEZI|nr:uncharacterized protein B0I36DRAFT_371555 [Microdochium trichocladiopsis]KAH7041293.1 hypothetical protein B0I36DRAFT_371555 [Microdochium trichocladiopsis]